jgi:hypothetical protein
MLEIFEQPSAIQSHLGTAIEGNEGLMKLAGVELT